MRAVSPEGVEPSNSQWSPASRAGVYSSSTTVTYGVRVARGRCLDEVPTEGFEPSQHTASETAASTLLGHVGMITLAAGDPAGGERSLCRRIRTSNPSDPNGVLCQVEPCTDARRRTATRWRRAREPAARRAPWCFRRRGLTASRPWWTSRESHPNHLLARQTPPLGDKPVVNREPGERRGSRRRAPAPASWGGPGSASSEAVLDGCGAQGSHLPPPARHAGAVARPPAPRALCSWITCESNAVRAPHQRAQGDQPVVIRPRTKGLPRRAERESNPHAPCCRRRSSPENRLGRGPRDRRTRKRSPREGARHGEVGAGSS